MKDFMCPPSPDGSSGKINNLERQAAMSEKSMIEKLARAVLASLQAGEAYVGAVDDDDDLTWVLVDGNVDLPALVRAVLQSLREHDEGMLEAMMFLPPSDAFTAAIDHILKESGTPANPI